MAAEKLDLYCTYIRVSLWERRLTGYYLKIQLKDDPKSDTRRPMHCDFEYTDRLIKKNTFLICPLIPDLRDCRQQAQNGR